MSDSPYFVSETERGILRSLAGRVAEIAQDPIMEERRRLWKKMNALEAERPMILTEALGIIDKNMPFNQPECENPFAKGLERALKEKIFNYERVGDDFVVEPTVTYGQSVQWTGFGVDAQRHRGEADSGMGSYSWEAPLKKLPDDLAKLSHRTLKFDKEATEATGNALKNLLGDVLDVKLRQGAGWSQGLTWTAIDLIGLEELMLKMYDEPEGLHGLMAFLRDDQMAVLDYYEQNGLLTPNNEDDYVASGGRGYTDLLPQSDLKPGQPARIKDLWGLSESQETVGVGPELFEEFIFPYQLPVISRFGFACYGCCEPVHNRWHIVKRIPNLRRVSVSPWCNIEFMAKELGKDYVFSRKPNPAHISTSNFDEDTIRKDLREVINATKGGNLEIVMKDVHTVSNDVDRLGKWSRIAREVIDEVYGG